ncbi:hypothetical protein JNB11_04200 [Kocuria palustris]|nr:hypothetical protein [Kocuria palustris]
MGDTINCIEAEKSFNEQLVADVSEKVNLAESDALPIQVVTAESHGDVDTGRMSKDHDRSDGIIRVVDSMTWMLICVAAPSSQTRAKSSV